MDIEKAEHINIVAVAVVLLLALTFFADQFVKNLAVSLSVGIIIVSFVLMVCLFTEIIGISILAFAITLVLITIMIGDWITGLFISSLLLGLIILFTVLTR